MPRLMLNDELWSKLRKIMLQNGIYDKPNLRIMVEGILYRIRVGCPWRDLPENFDAGTLFIKNLIDDHAKIKIIDIF